MATPEEKKTSKFKEFGRGAGVFVLTSVGTGLVIGTMVVLIRAGVEGQVDLPFLQRSLDFFLNNWESVVVPSLFGGAIIGGMTTVALYAPPEGESGSIVIDKKGEHEEEDVEEPLEKDQAHDFTKTEKIGVIKSHKSLLSGDTDFHKSEEKTDKREEKQAESTSKGGIRPGGGSKE